MASALKDAIEDATETTVWPCASLAEAEAEIGRGGVAFVIAGVASADIDSMTMLKRFNDLKIPVLVYCDHPLDDAFAVFRPLLIGHVARTEPDALDRLLAIVTRMVENSVFKILVVDDTTSARSMLSSLLTMRQFQVFEARSGQAALKIMAAHQNEIDLVITDYHMPDMDGHELTQRIRALRSSEELRIIGISASSDRTLSAQFLKAGASDFLYRPFVLEELQCRIDNNIETLKQLKRLKYFAERDSLTSLSNRRHFFEIGRQRAREAQRHNLESAIAILDIDHFKKVNDTYGHEAGDTVLKAVAGLLSRFAEKGPHVAARLGGEEFVLYLQGVKGKSAFEFCNAILAAISATQIPVNAHTLSVTASIGVADIEHGETFENYLNAADQFLYMAKNKGRNRVYCEGVMLGLY
ncbi:diguanylate cyclase [Rhizobium sp. RU20A]|uniref:GGDEF domain-containing response regulator n=1 Tax=Rhizobium sp. RU20A TaxID=1907412 RepID=UPI00165FAEAD|nr:diguanylate cyclase [Rhizobium sp. RU20A]